VDAIIAVHLLIIEGRIPVATIMVGTPTATMIKDMDVDRR